VQSIDIAAAHVARLLQLGPAHENRFCPSCMTSRSAIRRA
jgi:hypothetical protein